MNKWSWSFLYVCTNMIHNLQIFIQANPSIVTEIDSSFSITIWFIHKNIMELFLDFFNYKPRFFEQILVHLGKNNIWTYNPVAIGIIMLRQCGENVRKIVWNFCLFLLAIDEEDVNKSSAYDLLLNENKLFIYGKPI